MRISQLDFYCLTINIRKQLKQLSDIKCTSLSQLSNVKKDIYELNMYLETLTYAYYTYKDDPHGIRTPD